MIYKIKTREGLIFEVNDINSNFGGLSFYEDETGSKYVVGADSVPKKLGNVGYGYVAAIISGTNSSIYETERTAESTGIMHYTVFNTSATAKLSVGNTTINIIAKATEVYKTGSIEVTKGDKIILNSINSGWCAGTIVVWRID